MTAEIAYKLHLSEMLPASIMSEIEVLSLDESNGGTSSNYTYRYKNGPFECRHYPGFYYVPGFSNYCISKEGILKNVRSGKTISWVIHKPKPGRKNITGGYKVAGIHNDFKHRRGVSRHRLLALTFKHPKQHPGKLTVNHINGVPGDDRLDNLEFCTHRENTQHAYNNGLYPNKIRSISALNWITGEKYEFPSIIAACTELGFNHTLITHRLNRSNSIKYEDGWRFKDASHSWFPLNERTGQMSTNVSVIARCVSDNSIVIFGSYMDASRHTGVHQGAIQTQTYDEPLYPVKGWNFRKLEGFRGWPTYSDFLLSAILRNPGKKSAAIIVHDLENNSESYYDDCEAAGLHFSISPITVSKLTREGKLYSKRYQFEKLVPEAPNGPFDQ